MDTYLVEFLVILAYFVMIVYKGVRNSTRATHFDYYAFGRNKLSSASIAYSMITALIGANFIMNNMGIAFVGVVYLLGTFVGEWLSFVVWGKVLSSKGFANDKYLSICDIIEDLYGRNAAIISGIIATVSSIFSVILQFYLCCYFFEVSLGVSKLITCAVLCGLMISYVTFFGIDSITKTNLIQILTMVIVLPILLNVVLYDIGDSWSFFKNLSSISYFDTKCEINMWRICILFFSIGCCPAVIHRRFIASSGAQFYKAMKKTCFCIIVFQVFFVFFGLCYISIYPDAEYFSYDMLINTLQKIPHFLRGVVFAGIISVVLSSVDAHTHTGVVAFIYDVVRRLKGDMNSYGNFLLRYARIGIISFLLISTAVTLMFGGVDFVVQFRIFWVGVVVIPAFIGLVLLIKPKHYVWMLVFIGYVITYAVLYVCYYSGILHVFTSQIPVYACFICVMVFMIAYLYDLYKIGKLQHFLKYNFLREWSMYIKELCEEISFFVLDRLKACNYIKYIKKEFDNYGINNIAFSILMLFNMFFSSFMNSEYEDMYGICISIKFIASVLALISLMYKYMPDFYLRNKEIFFVITLMICGPIYSFIFIGVTNGDIYWHIYTMINIVLLSFIVDWVSFFIVLVVGFFTARFILSHVFLMDVDLISIVFCSFEVIVSYLLSVCICFVIFYGKKFLIEYNQVNAYKSSVGIISHETVTPLMLINNKLKKILKINPEEEDLRGKLKELASDGILLVSSIFSFYDLFLKNIISFVGDSSNVKVIKVSAKTAIEHVVSLYPLNDTQKNIIKMDLCDDFIISTNVMLLKHIIHNIIRNALFFVSGNEKPSINIKLVKHTYKSYNYVEISDNGIGMDERTLSNIFQKFYTKRVNGAGLGLYFCKNAMYSMMGDISVDSTEGHGTTFTLMFPHGEVMENAIEWEGDISSLC